MTSRAVIDEQIRQLEIIVRSGHLGEPTTWAAMAKLDRLRSELADAMALDVQEDEPDYLVA